MEKPSLWGVERNSTQSHREKENLYGGQWGTDCILGDGGWNMTVHIPTRTQRAQKSIWWWRWMIKGMRSRDATMSATV